MKNKGFTIIELITVIVILSIIMIVVIPGIGSLFEDTKNDSRNSKIKELETETYEYSFLSKDDIKKVGCITYQINDLIESGYILSESKNKDEFIDPVTNKNFDGKICVCFNNSDNDLLVKYIEQDSNCNIEIVK